MGKFWGIQRPYGYLAITLDLVKYLLETLCSLMYNKENITSYCWKYSLYLIARSKGLLTREEISQA